MVSLDGHYIRINRAEDSLILYLVCRNEHVHDSNVANRYILIKCVEVNHFCILEPIDLKIYNIYCYVVLKSFDS